MIKNLRNHSHHRNPLAYLHTVRQSAHPIYRERNPYHLRTFVVNDRVSYSILPTTVVATSLPLLHSQSLN